MILVGTPMKRGAYNLSKVSVYAAADYARQKVEVFEAFDDVRVQLTFLATEPWKARILLARNTCIDEALRCGASHLWFVDSDVVVPPKALLALLSLDADIASGTYPLRPDPYYVTSGGFHEKKGVVRSYLFKRHELTGKVLTGSVWCGMGCTLIKRRVFQTLRFNLEDLSTWGNEDVSYFWNARKRGFSVKLHTGIVCGHALKGVMTAWRKLVERKML